MAPTSNDSSAGRSTRRWAAPAAGQRPPPAGSGGPASTPTPPPSRPLPFGRGSDPPASALHLALALLRLDLLETEQRQRLWTESTQRAPGGPAGLRRQGGVDSKGSGGEPPRAWQRVRSVAGGSFPEALLGRTWMSKKSSRKALPLRMGSLFEKRRKGARHRSQSPLSVGVGESG